MNRRIALTITAVLCSGLIVSTSNGLAQQKSLKEQLTGTWLFVSSVDTNKDGTKVDRWGPNPKGIAIFEPNGYFSFMISRSEIPKFAANNVNEGTAAENTAVVRGIIASTGTWSVDEASKTITTNILVGSFPNMVGNSQKRVIVSLTADELRYTNSTSSTGAVADAVWKRAR